MPSKGSVARANSQESQKQAAPSVAADAESFSYISLCNVHIHFPQMPVSECFFTMNSYVLQFVAVHRH